MAQLENWDAGAYVQNPDWLFFFEGHEPKAHLVHDRCPNRTYWLLDEKDQKRIGSIAYKSMIKTSQFFNFNLDLHLHPLLEMGTLSFWCHQSKCFIFQCFILASSFLLSSLSVNEQRTKPCLLEVLSERILPSYMRYGQNPVTVGEQSIHFHEGNLF